jgi:hypothetical protein
MPLAFGSQIKPPLRRTLVRLKPPGLSRRYRNEHPQGVYLHRPTHSVIAVSMFRKPGNQIIFL